MTPENGNRTTASIIATTRRLQNQAVSQERQYNTYPAKASKLFEVLNPPRSHIGPISSPLPPSQTDCDQILPAEDLHPTDTPTTQQAGPILLQRTKTDDNDMFRSPPPPPTETTTTMPMPRIAPRRRNGTTTRNQQRNPLLQPRTTDRLRDGGTIALPPVPSGPPVGTGASSDRADRIDETIPNRRRRDLSRLPLPAPIRLVPRTRRFPATTGGPPPPLRSS